MLGSRRTRALSCLAASESISTFRPPFRTALPTIQFYTMLKAKDLPLLHRLDTRPQPRRKRV
jgi:hypothetical protein